MLRNLKKLSALFIILFISIFHPRLYIGTDLSGYLKTTPYYVRLVGYTDFSFKQVHVFFPNIYDFDIPDGHDIQFSGIPKQDVVRVITEMNKVLYDKDQANPELVFEHGGNCQAVTLLTKAYLDVAHINNTVVMESTHMYNKVFIDSKWYKLDIVNKIFEEVDYE